MKIALASLAVAMVAAASSAAADSYRVTIATGHPPVFRWVKMIDEVFIPSAEAALLKMGHEITFSKQYGGAIAKVGEELEAIQVGLAEMGTCQSVFEPAKMTAQNVTYYTPFVTEDIRTVSNVMERLLRENDEMQAAFSTNGVVYVGAPIIIDDYLLMTKYPVELLADLDGRKIAAPGAALNWLSGTGAVGVSGNLTTYYNEIKTGVIDGALLFGSAVLPSKIHEVAPYVKRIGLGAQFAASLCANEAWFESLPEDVRNALLAAADEASEWYLSALETAVEQAFATLEGQGIAVTSASPEMRAAWAGQMDDVAGDWAADLSARGGDGTALLKDYMNAVRAAGATPLRDWDIAR